MRDLIRMYLYRMRKTKAFWILLILAFFFGFVITPLEKGFVLLLELSGDDPAEAALLFPMTSELSGIIGNPFPLMNAMLMFLSAFAFFGADTSRGYIRNTIGLMPKRAHSLMAEFCAVMLHNALFMAAGVLGNLIGTALFRQIVPDGEILKGILTFATKYVLALSLTTLIMWLTVGKGNKGLAIVTAILIGNRTLMMIWELLSMGIGMLLKIEGFSLTDYMPDCLIYTTNLKQPYAILVAAGLLALLLPLSLRSFEKRDL